MLRRIILLQSVPLILLLVFSSCSNRKKPKEELEVEAIVKVMQMPHTPSPGCNHKALEGKRCLILENIDAYKPIKTVVPKYSKSIAERVQGKIEVFVSFNYKGDVISVCTLEGPVELRELAEEAAWKMKFKQNPFMQSDNVYMDTVIAFNFVSNKK